MPEHNVSLLVAGVDYYGWLIVTISSDLEKIARDFEVSLTRRKGFYYSESYGDFSDDAFSIKLGDDVVVKIDGEPVLVQNSLCLLYKDVTY